MSQPRNTASTSSRGRHIARVGTAIGIALVALTTACSDAPSAPASASPAPPAPRLAKASGGPGKSVPASRSNPLGAPITVKYRIDPAKNGRIEIKQAGLEIDVPQGAVASPVEVTVTALRNQVAYEFQPHGLVFRRPLRARQDLRAAGINLLGGLLSASGSGSSVTFGIPMLEVSYFTDAQSVTVGGPTNVLEFLASSIDVRTNRVEFDIHHFSGYMVSWGRTRSW